MCSLLFFYYFLSFSSSTEEVWAPVEGKELMARELHEAEPFQQGEAADEELLEWKHIPADE